MERITHRAGDGRRIHTNQRRVRDMREEHARIHKEFVDGVHEAMLKRGRPEYDAPDE